MKVTYGIIPAHLIFFILDDSRQRSQLFQNKLDDKSKVSDNQDIEEN